MLNQFARLFCFVWCASSPFLSLADESRYLSRDFEFEIGSHEHLFGHRVVLRSEPSKQSIPLDTLSIDSELTILEKMEKIETIDGNSSHWYKVKHRKTVGYVLAHFIALDRSVLDGVVYLVRYTVQAETENGRVEYRLVRANQSYLEGTVPARTYAFGIQTYDDRGLEGVQSMLQIHFHAEACGVNGGSVYIFHVDDNLLPIADLSSVSEAGLFWFSEHLIFPTDEQGEPGVVFYFREHGEYLDEEMNWEELKITKRRITWYSDHFEPSIDILQAD